MKTALAFACLIFASFLQQFSLAAPTTSDPCEGADYRAALFGKYLCRVRKAIDGIRDRLSVSFIIN